MTADIATMPAGPELDALVARALGFAIEPKSWPWGGGYSTSNANSTWALERWCEQHPEWTGMIMLPAPQEPNYCVQLWPVSDANTTPIIVAPTLALSISRAIAMVGGTQ